MADIKIFSTATCPYCVRAKKYLTEKNISFVDIDVAADPMAAEEMISLSGQMGVPVIVIDGDVIIGFDKTRIAAKLGFTP